MLFSFSHERNMSKHKVNEITLKLEDKSQNQLEELKKKKPRSPRTDGVVEIAKSHK